MSILIPSAKTQALYNIMMQDYQTELVAIKDLLKKNSNGMSVTDISKALKKNKNTIGRYLDVLLISGQVDMRAYGMAKVYTISQRIPFSAMLSYSKELIMILDNESRIIDINNNFLALLHLSREETLGKNISFIQSPEVDVRELLDLITKDLKEEETTVTFHVKGGEERIFHPKSIPTVFDDGRKGITLILEDITGRILADRAIRKSEERFRMMADNIQDGLIIAEGDKMLYANNRITEITGYSFGEIKSMGPLAIIAPDSFADAIQQMQDVEANPEKSGALWTWIIRKDGERRFVYARISGTKHDDTYYNFVIFTDITDLKYQEARVRESEQRFRVMADNIQDGLIIIENGKIVFSNSRIMQITGYSANEIAEMGVNGTLFTNDPNASDPGSVQVAGNEGIAKIFRNVQTDSTVPGEFKLWIQRKDSKCRYIHGKITAAKNDGMISFYIALSDITDFAEREKTLRERIDALQDLIH